MEIKYRFRRTGCYIARNDHYVSWTSKTSERNTIVKYSIWDFFVKLLVPTILNKLWENGEFKIVDASFKQPQANACKKGMESAYNHCFKETMWFYRKMFDPIRTSCISDKSKKKNWNNMSVFQQFISWWVAPYDFIRCMPIYLCGIIYRN